MSRLLRWFFAIGFLAGTTALCAEPEIRIVKGKDGEPAGVEATGLAKEALASIATSGADAQWLSRVLAMYVVGNEGIQRPAITGRHEVVAGALRFTPRYPLRPGMKYLAVLNPPPPGPEVSPARYTLQIEVPGRPRGEPTRVTAIYPSAATLPDNQLRFYIHFSAPMRQGEAYTHIKLIGANGEVDKRAFLEVGEELWDPSGQRLTLLFDPGRVKRGLKPREEFGPVLEAGKQYTLVIDRAWRDAEGEPLAAGYEKRFAAGPPVETAVNPAEWKIVTPAAGTSESLLVRFPRPLDRGLLAWTIGVKGAGGKSISGDIVVADEEQRWGFRPDQPWVAGEYQLVVDTTLEDTAGNSIARPFEVDVFNQVDKSSAAEYVKIPFRIGATRP